MTNREIDVLVGKHIFGLTIPDEWSFELLPEFTNLNSEARHHTYMREGENFTHKIIDGKYGTCPPFIVVNKMMDDDWEVKIEGSTEIKNSWIVNFTKYDGYDMLESEERDANLGVAICRAALNTKGIVV